MTQSRMLCHATRETSSYPRGPSAAVIPAGIASSGPKAQKPHPGSWGVRETVTRWYLRFLARM